MKHFCQKTNHLEEGEERMFVTSIHIDLLCKLKVRFEAAAWSHVFQTIENFGSVVAGFLLKKVNAWKVL